MTTTFKCILDEEIAESLQDPEYRAAYEAAEARWSEHDRLNR